MGKSLGNIFRSYVIPIALGVATGGAGFGLSALGSAGVQGAYAAGRNLSAGGNIGSALRSGGLAAGGNYLGSQLAGNSGNVAGSLPSRVSGVGGAYGPSPAPSLGLGSVGQSISSNILSTPVSQIAGNIAGNQLSGALMPQRQPANQTPAGFVPRQQDALEAPASLTGFGSLNSGQQESNLANRGVYGGGLGPQENQYFLNLINRQLVDRSGQTGDANNLNPISRSYLQRLGLGGFASSNNLLENISKWQMA